tara:strand:- start:3116 stop:3646 length:531 start_codon:yes stop_codon:yes gene_type:complete
MKSSTNKSNIVQVDFTDEMVERAIDKSKWLGKINNSILKGRGNFAGFLGEEIVADYIQAEIISKSKSAERFNYDLIKGSQKIEVKSKRRKVPPKDFYDASVAETSAHQRPDIYIFTSIQFKNHKPIRAWICGQKDAKEYFQQANFYAEGDIDPSNGWKVSTDCHNLPYKDLDPVGR